MPRFRLLILTGFLSAVQNNGVSVKLLTLSGTIPIFYRAVQYNIPVELFIPINYPNECPKLFVRPTPSKSCSQLQ